MRLPIFFDPDEHRFIKQFNKLEGENTGLRRQYDDMLDLFNMNELQMEAYLNLVHKKSKSKAEVEHLMEQIGGKIRKNLRYNINLLIEQGKINDTKMEEMLPMLSVSERKICRLVLEGKKLSEMSHIRQKRIQYILPAFEYSFETRNATERQSVGGTKTTNSLKTS